MKRVNIDRLVKIWLPILIIIAIAVMLIYNIVNRANIARDMESTNDRAAEILEKLENLGISNENFAFERLKDFERARLTLLLSNLWEYRLLIDGEEVSLGEAHTYTVTGEDVEVVLIERMAANGLPERISYIGSVCQGDMGDSVKNHIFSGIPASKFESEHGFIDNKLTVENRVKFGFKIKSGESIAFNHSPILAEKFDGVLSFQVKR